MEEIHQATKSIEVQIPFNKANASFLLMTRRRVVTCSLAGFVLTTECNNEQKSSSEFAHVAGAYVFVTIEKQALKRELSAIFIKPNLNFFPTILIISCAYFVRKILKKSTSSTDKSIAWQSSQYRKYFVPA